MRGLGGMTGLVGEAGRMAASYGPMGSGFNWANLSSYYKFDGDLNDSTANALTLTDGNGANPITYVTGKIVPTTNGAAYLNNNYSSGYVAVTNPGPLYLGSGVSFAVAGWLQLQSGGAANQVLAGQYDYPFTNQTWRVYHSPGSDTTLFQIYREDGGSFDYTISSNVLTAGTWYYLVFGYDASSEVCYFSKDGAAKSTSGSTTGYYARARTSLYSYGIQCEGGVVAPKAYYDGWAFFKGRVLTNSDITALYNGGNGRNYPN